MGALVAVWLIIWIICAFVAAGIANGKGLSAGGYFFLGLILGVIGIIIAAVATPAQRPAVASNAGWHADPLGHAALRYFDGSKWTEYVSSDGKQWTDPLGSAPS